MSASLVIPVTTETTVFTATGGAFAVTGLTLTNTSDSVAAEVTVHVKATTGITKGDATTRSYKTAIPAKDTYSVTKATGNILLAQDQVITVYMDSGTTNKVTAMIDSAAL